MFLKYSTKHSNEQSVGGEVENLESKPYEYNA